MSTADLIARVKNELSWITVPNSRWRAENAELRANLERLARSAQGETALLPGLQWLLKQRYPTTRDQIKKKISRIERKTMQGHGPTSASSGIPPLGGPAKPAPAPDQPVAWVATRKGDRIETRVLHFSRHDGWDVQEVLTEPHADAAVSSQARDPAGPASAAGLRRALRPRPARPR